MVIPNLYRTAKISHPGVEALEAAPASPDWGGGTFGILAEKIGILKKKSLGKFREYQGNLHNFG